MEILIILICICIFVLYVVIDNRRINIRRQNIRCGNVGKSIRILQVSDLHSKILRNADYNKINALSYDLIAFTGDTFVNTDLEHVAIIDFMNKVKNTKVVLYVDGNNGTRAYSRRDNTLTEFGRRLEKLGITVIRDKCEINGIIFTNYNAISSKLIENKIEGEYGIYSTLNDSMRKCKIPNIGVSHYPLDKEAIKLVNKTDKYYVPNLIIAGHLHGGHIRMPIIGPIAIYKRDGRHIKLFPNKKLVSGLYEEGKVKQYVSRGAGSATHVKLLSFKLFNTPEIDLLNIRF